MSKKLLFNKGGSSGGTSITVDRFFNGWIKTNGLVTETEYSLVTDYIDISLASGDIEIALTSLTGLEYELICVGMYSSSYQFLKLIFPSGYEGSATIKESDIVSNTKYIRIEWSCTTGDAMSNGDIDVTITM